MTAPWLVTGATGFLGRHLLHAIEQDPTPRRAIALVRDRAQWDALEWTRPLATTVPLEGGLLAPPDPDEPAWWSSPELEGLAGIFHLAALVRHGRRDADAVHRANVEGTLAMVRLAARKRCRLVFVSTSGTVGCFREPGGTADEESPFCEELVGGWPYYASKIRAERESRALAARLGVELVILRPPVLLGPDDHRHRSTAHVGRFLQGKVPFVIEGGMHFADVRDVAAALPRAMTIPRPRPVYHLPGTVCSIRDFYRAVAAESGARPPRMTIPFRPAWWLARLSARLGLGLLPEPVLIEMASRHWSMTSRYAEAELGYRSRPGRDTLADTVRWLRADSRGSAPVESGDT